MFEQFIDMIGWEMLGGAVLLLVVAFRNRSKLASFVSEPTPETLTECDVIVEDLQALEALEFRAIRLGNKDMAKACEVIRHQWLVEGTVENA